MLARMPARLFDICTSAFKSLPEITYTSELASIFSVTNFCSQPVGSQTTGHEGAKSRENKASPNQWALSTGGRLCLFTILLSPRSFKMVINMDFQGFAEFAGNSTHILLQLNDLTLVKQSKISERSFSLSSGANWPRQTIEAASIKLSPSSEALRLIIDQSFSSILLAQMLMFSKTTLERMCAISASSIFQLSLCPWLTSS